LWNITTDEEKVESICQCKQTLKKFETEEYEMLILMQARYEATLFYIVMSICVFVAFYTTQSKSSNRSTHHWIFICPYGLPMIGATMIAFIELINDKIKTV